MLTRKSSSQINYSMTEIDIELATVAHQVEDIILKRGGFTYHYDPIILKKQYKVRGGFAMVALGYGLIVNIGSTPFYLSQEGIATRKVPNRSLNTYDSVQLWLEAIKRDINKL